MGKKKGGDGGGKKRGGGGGVWTAADHEERSAAKQAKLTQKQVDRSALLSHDTEDKREQKKLQLHITKTVRHVDGIRERLRQWDDVTEAKRRKAEEEKRRKEEEEADENAPKKVRRRAGPETWKLRGAARPAWEVYDFDTRYIDPHIKAHEDDKARVKRSRNMLVLFKNNFDSPEAPPICRAFLTLLMQLALLYRQANKIKASRKTLLECLDLDSLVAPISLARCHLMRLYLEAKRPESAERLLDRLPDNDKSVWIQYSRLLIEYQKHSTKGDDGDEDSSDTNKSLEAALVLAVRANVYCAYYLAFGETFDSVIEYAEEIEDATDQEPLEEAIEFCNSEVRQDWEEEKGATQWLQDKLLAVLGASDDEKGEGMKSLLSAADLDWETPLKRMEEAAKVAREEEEAEQDEEEEDEEDIVDVTMFAGMFRTAMEMVEEQSSSRSDLGVPVPMK